MIPTCLAGRRSMTVHDSMTAAAWTVLSDRSSALTASVDRRTSASCLLTSRSATPTVCTAATHHARVLADSAPGWLGAAFRRVHTHLFNGPLSGTTRVSQYHKGKTNLDFTEARDSELQWHQLDHMQVCTSLQTDATTASHRSVFYGPDALPAAQPTVSKH